MFHFLLGVNALTDWREGYVYDGLSLLLFLCAVSSGLSRGMGQWFPVTLLLLAILRQADRSETCLGRGDYLILLSVSLYCDEIPLILILTSATALAGMTISRRRQLPLIPFLYLGCLITEINSCLK